MKIFEAYECIFKRQKGDHLVYNFPGAKGAVVIPKHKEIGVCIIKDNVKTVGMSDETYVKLLDEI